MKREWKPGDVATAVVTTRGRERRRVKRVDNASHPWLVLDDLGGLVSARVVESIRPTPLVVIDPEDREQVERLNGLLESKSFSAWACGAVSCMQAALREFADPKPPKPPEPTGLGAVVEDADGSLLVRSSREGAYPWIAEGGARFSWADIDVVRVVSEGVTDQ